MKSRSRGTVKSRSNQVLREYRFDYARAKPNRFADVPASKSPSRVLDEAKVADIMEALKASLTAAKKPVPNGPVTVVLDADVARVFRTTETVNSVLRAILTAEPPRRRR